MKLSAKPISSPGRTDKFPPPLMRFLRTNVGSRSRGRLRSSPMFVRKKNTAIETQEPSSPKVTCMGQVRVRRSSKQGGSKPLRARRTGAPTLRRCKWIQNALPCRHFPGKIKPKSFGPVWRKWVPFFQVGFCRKGKIKEDPPKIESNFGDGIEVSDGEDEEEDQEYERKAKAFVSSSSSSPPKNALLLTRCRSAPYRSSSLASRFWGSPIRAEETEEEQSTETQNGGNCTENERPISERESISDQETKLDSESEEKLKFFRELESSIRERMAKSAIIEDKDEDFGGSARPLILTRCKSEPARTAEKLDPELSFWRKRRLGIVDSCSPPSVL
ncbi:hypothetical protein CerSpe_222920 [Prunus speciosa]